MRLSIAGAGGLLGTSCRRYFGPHDRHHFVLAVVFVLYTAAVTVTAFFHEPWFDEAQSWLLARDSGVVELFTERLRYEGSPGLWHVLLMVPAKLGLPYWTMTAISVLVATTTVYLFLRYSPFPLHVKVMFPFGFFTLYQYAVVARSYVVMALLMVALAVVFRKRNARPVMWFCLLALLANVNVHGFLMAGLIAAYHLWQLWSERRTVPPGRLRGHLIGAALFGAIAILVVLQLLPPGDLNYSISTMKLVNLSIATNCLTSNVWVSLLVLGLSSLLFWRRKMILLWVMPTLALLWIFVFKWASVWHEGIVYYYWILCLWIAMERPMPGTTSPGCTAKGDPTRYVHMALTVVLAGQIYWGVVSCWHDIRYPYSGSCEASQYLAERHLTDREIFAQGWGAVSVLPFFSENVFDNHNDKRNPSYHVWAEGNPLEKSFYDMRRDKPQYILVATKSLGEPGETPDYELLQRFVGNLFWKTIVLERESFYLYQRRKGSRST